MSRPDGRKRPQTGYRNEAPWKYHYPRGRVSVGHTPTHTFCGLPLAKVRLADDYAGKPNYAPCKTCLYYMTQGYTP